MYSAEQLYIKTDIFAGKEKKVLDSNDWDESLTVQDSLNAPFLKILQILMPLRIKYYNS